MSAEHSPSIRPTAAKPLAPEEVLPGDYVAVLDQEHEYAASSWYLDPPMLGGDDVIRVRLRPSEPEPPLLVQEVCVPFVFAKAIDGSARTLDLRATRLARIDAGVGRRLWSPQSETTTPTLEAAKATESVSVDVTR
ncbi:MAG: hypothetical protein AAGJ46_09625 [Planctomycetota bacterium]